MTEGSSSPPRVFAVVPCAGVGARSGASGPKQYVALAGWPMVAHTLRALFDVACIDTLQVVLTPADSIFDEQVRPHLPSAQLARLRVSHSGGDTRAQTVLGGLRDLAAAGARDQDWVLVHDAARCLVRPEQVQRLVDACEGDAVGGLLALPVADTLKSEADGRVDATLDRRGKWAAQTPQMFRLGPLRDALQRAGDAATDESSAVEAAGHRPLLVVGSAENFKVTYPDDFALAERLLATRGS